VAYHLTMMRKFHKFEQIPIEMKNHIKLGLLFGLLTIFAISCEKEQPAKNIEGNYTGTLSGIYSGQDTIIQNYPVFATSSTKNKILVQSTIFTDFEVLVSQNGINVIPVSTTSEVPEFLYQGDLNELSFKYYKNGDSTVYVGTKP
jgi:hypothetical protein